MDDVRRCSMRQESLFYNKRIQEPLANRLRPQDLEDYVGQKHLLGKGKILTQLIENDTISSMIFWGPPGVEKLHWHVLLQIKQKVSLLILVP